jgi:hypothetical protein
MAAQAATYPEGRAAAETRVTIIVRNTLSPFAGITQAGSAGMISARERGHPGVEKLTQTRRKVNGGRLSKESGRFLEKAAQKLF